MKDTKPITYRISTEVDTELRRLAKIQGGVDNALRVLFEWQSPLIPFNLKPIPVEDIASLPNQQFKAPLRRIREKGDKSR